MNEEFEKMMNDLMDKLDKNPKIKEKINENIEEIEKLLGFNVEMSIQFSPEADEYKKIFEGYDEDDLDFDESMTLNMFLDFIKEEDGDLEVVIDPLHLKNGMNSINNLIVTTYENKLVLVPTTNKKKDE